MTENEATFILKFCVNSFNKPMQTVIDMLYSSIEKEGRSILVGLGNVLQPDNVLSIAFDVDKPDVDIDNEKLQALIDVFEIFPSARLAE